MNNHTFSSAFGFREYNFSNTRYVNLKHGARYNYVNYLIEGQAEIIGENFSITLNEGDMVFIPRGAKYKSYWSGKSKVRYNSFSFLYYPSNNIKTHPPQKITPNEKIMDYLSQLPGDNDVNCFSVGTFLLMLDELFKVMSFSDEDKKLVILEKAMHHMRTSPLSTVPQIAKMCSISESALYLLFSTYMDCTPSEFKLNARLEQALHYLISTDIPIEEISDLCGFSSSSYFRKNFTKKYGQSPREARKNPYQWENDIL